MTGPAARIGITGATGTIGGKVARHLADGQVPTRLIVRDPLRAPNLPHAEVATASYGDGDACRSAFDGLDTLFLVSASESDDRVEQHRTAVDAAAAAGVGHVVYLSFVGAAADATFLLARDHGATEDHVRASGMRWTFLRDNLYTEAIATMFGEDGAIRGPAGHGELACVGQDDVAAVAALVLSDPTAHRDATYELTGPNPIGLAEFAVLLSSARQAEHRFVDETMDEAYASREPYGAPRWMVDAWISTYTAIRDGSLADVSQDIPRLLGRPALSVAEVLSGHR
ncbi:uncharacterized protein YbjT (DUF2867 family) [Mumia flava]|uniref:Uncharacterized protein YbjT (DUF2867 family) n=1 Tax=Mumia flava TaxID=1348852 RepID=A0A0B2B6W5_9ACTN|nr:NAD(P)H-binding protein [Mumia flava]PJJ57842.1 uncharacterized protein YbjT (DUF2867 family) [Mumia flava]